MLAYFYTEVSPFYRWKRRSDSLIFASNVTWPRVDQYTDRDFASFGRARPDAQAEGLEIVNQPADGREM